MSNYLRTAPWWEKSIYMGGSAAFFLFLLLYWRLYFSSLFVFSAAVFGCFVAVWLTWRSWPVIRRADPRDHRHTWVSTAVRKQVLRRELLLQWLATAAIVCMFTLLIGASTLVLTPTENRTVTISNLDVCKRRCANCKNQAVVALLPGLSKRVCVDELVPPLMSAHTVIIRGRFTPYAGLVQELRQGPEAGAYLLDMLERLEIESSGHQKNATPSPR